MTKIRINTAQKVVPMIYAYTTPEIQRHNGWTKIGYTEQGVDKRLNQQTHTADVLYHEEWRGTAIYDDGSGDIFRERVCTDRMRPSARHWIILICMKTGSSFGMQNRALEKP